MTITFFDVFDPESRYPVFDRLCDNLSIGDIIALTRTCRKFSGCYQYLLPIQWDVDRCLRRFVRSSTGLRSKMAETNALISSSFAIQFFERVVWPSSNLDMYVEEGEDSDTIAQYLVMSEGYTLEDTIRPQSFDYAVGEVVTLRKYTRLLAESEKTSISSIFSTPGIPIKVVLKKSYSTLAVNWITWNKAYSLYPLLTFIQYKGHQLTPFDESFQQQAAKYSGRGWNLQAVMLPEDDRHNHPIRSPRRVGDKYSWIIEFDVSKVEDSPIPDSVLEYSTFFLARNHRGKKDAEELTEPLFADNYYTVQGDACTSDCLRHTYVMSDQLRWWLILNKVPRKKIQQSLQKLEPSARPHNYDEAVEWLKENSKLPADFVQPDTWTYWDAEWPSWYKRWEEFYPRTRASREEKAKRHEYYLKID